MKNNLLKMLSMVIALLVTSCIENDVPYPTIKGEVLKFAAVGETESVISKDQQTIKVVLADTVDIRKVKISQFEITPEAVCDLDVSKPIDCSQPVKFTITTYQKYQWVLEVSQPIERKVLLENQVGDAQIDVANTTVIVNVAASQDLYNINVIEMKLGPSTATTTPDPKLIKNFSRPQTFIVRYLDIVEEWRVFVIPTQVVVSTGNAQPWGMFAYLNGSIQAGSSETPAFEIRQKSESDWRVLSGSNINVSGSKITAKAVGLLPSTAYVYRAKLGENIGNEIEFTTEATPIIANLSFEDGYMAGKTWYPNAEGGNSYWATGNEGVTSALVGKNSNTTQVTDAVGGKAVRMETISVPVVQIAAGNLFTGTYKTIISNPKASAVMGRPYTGRPTQLVGWYKYSPRPINIDKDGKYQNMIGKSDFGHIYLRLENWGSATVRPANPKVIAYGEFKTDKEVSTYTKFQFDITYSDTETMPTHVSLVSTSSIYGEDFCGGVGSVLYVDEFSLVFE